MQAGSDNHPGEPDDEANEESPFRDRPSIDDQTAEDLLATADLIVLGQMPWSSNTTLLCDLDSTDPVAQAVYKPHRGERMLWDFPPGLGARETASYELSKALGWALVPPTVLRDGPLGLGSVQLFAPSRFEEHYFTLQDNPEHRDEFERLVCFDYIANSTDRKSGHVLLGTDDRIYAIDNGLSFHTEFKLRTVLWDFADEPMPEALVEDIHAFAAGDTTSRFPELCRHLSEAEIEAMIERAQRLAVQGRFPTDPTGRRWPWPLV